MPSVKLIDADDVRSELVTLEAALIVLDDLHNEYFAKGYTGIGYDAAKKRVTAIAVLLRNVADNLDALVSEEE